MYNIISFNYRFTFNPAYTTSYKNKSHSHIFLPLNKLN
jgi:hypothetical protein